MSEVKRKTRGRDKRKDEEKNRKKRDRRKQGKEGRKSREERKNVGMEEGRKHVN